MEASRDQCGREGENSIGEWDLLKGYMGNNVRQCGSAAIDVSDALETRYVCVYFDLVMDHQFKNSA